MGKKRAAVVIDARNSLYLTDLELAALLHVSVGTVRRWRLRGGGPKWVRISSRIRYARDDLNSFLATLPSGGGVSEGGLR